jgi:hypothetical protein
VALVMPVACVSGHCMPFRVALGPRLDPSRGRPRPRDPGTVPSGTGVFPPHGVPPGAYHPRRRRTIPAGGGPSPLDANHPPPEAAHPPRDATIPASCLPSPPDAGHPPRDADHPQRRRTIPARGRPFSSGCLPSPLDAYHLCRKRTIPLGMPTIPAGCGSSCCRPQKTRESVNIHPSAPPVNRAIPSFGVSTNGTWWDVVARVGGCPSRPPGTRPVGKGVKRGSGSWPGGGGAVLASGRAVCVLVLRPHVPRLVQYA